MAIAPERLVVGIIHTLNPARPVARAALVRDGRFACVGPRRGVRRERGAGHAAAPGRERGAWACRRARARDVARRASLEVSSRGSTARRTASPAWQRGRAPCRRGLDPRARLGSEPLARPGASRWGVAHARGRRTTRSRSYAWTATRSGRTRPRSPPLGSAWNERSAGRAAPARRARPAHRRAGGRGDGPRAERIPAPTPGESRRRSGARMDASSGSASPPPTTRADARRARRLPPARGGGPVAVPRATR